MRSYLSGCRQRWCQMHPLQRFLGLTMAPVMMTLLLIAFTAIIPLAALIYSARLVLGETK